MCSSKHKLLACVGESQHWSLRSHALTVAQLASTSQLKANYALSLRGCFALFFLLCFFFLFLFFLIYKRAIVWELSCECGAGVLFLSGQFAAVSPGHPRTKQPDSVNHAAASSYSGYFRRCRKFGNHRLLCRSNFSLLLISVGGLFDAHTGWQVHHSSVVKSTQY